MHRYLAPIVMALTMPSAAGAAEVAVQMEGADYSPSQIEARVGDQLVFVNDDLVDHDVFVPTAGHGVDLGKQVPGATTVLPLGKPGRFEVECVIHPHMHLEVLVRP